jgi:hypothetical protein
LFYLVIFVLVYFTFSNTTSLTTHSKELPSHLLSFGPVLILIIDVATLLWFGIFIVIHYSLEYNFLEDRFSNLLVKQWYGALVDAQYMFMHVQVFLSVGFTGPVV